jgi:uncharacterized protein YndB with AHSA1/START domain
MKILIRVAATLVVLVLVVVIIGYALPRDHQAASSAVISGAPDSVFAVITNPAGYSAWRTDVTKIEMRQADSGRVAWTEYMGSDAIPMVITASAAPNRVVSRIDSRSLPFGGTWTYNIMPVAGGSRVTIIEDGSVYNPVFRFVSRFVMGHNGTMDGYLRALGKKFGTAVEPTHGKAG